MARKSASRKRLDAVVHPALLLLRSVKIGPIFPNPEEIKDVPKGMRRQPRRKTVSPFDDKYRKNRRLRNRVRHGTIN